MTTKTHPRIGLVIGSGGVKCSAAMGLWRVLDREGIAVDMTVGCSGGGLFAAAIALDWKLQDVEEKNARLWDGVFGGYSRRSLLKAILPRLFGFDQDFGLVDDRRLNEVIETMFGNATFSQTRVPLYLVATDLHTGLPVVLSEGRIADAVRASCAVPIILRPWPVAGRLLIDGAAADPLPISVAIREGCEIILAMGFENPYSPHLNSILNLVDRTSGIIINNLLKSRYAFYNLAHHAEVIPILPVFDRPIGLRDTRLIPYIVAEGQRAAEEQVPYLRRLLAAAAA